MIKRLIWTIWTPMSSVLKKADKPNLSLSLGELPARIFSDHQTHSRVLTLECRLLTKCEVDPHGPSCSEWPEIFTQYMDHRTNDSSSVCGVCEAYYISSLAPAANLCTLSAIVFFPIKTWIWCHLRRYIDGNAILLTVKGPVWPRWLKISPCVTMKIMWNETAFR